MATESVHEIYQRVVAKRPEAAVRGELGVSFDKSLWESLDIVYEGDMGRETTAMLPEYVAESLIVAHWLSEATRIQSAGHYLCLQKRADGTHRLCRFEPNSETWEQLGTGATPLQALAAYLERNT